MKRLISKLIILASIYLSCSAFAECRIKIVKDAQKQKKECKSTKVYDEEENYTGCFVCDNGELKGFSVWEMSEEACEDACVAKRMWFGSILVPSIEFFL